MLVSTHGKLRVNRVQVSRGCRSYINACIHTSACSDSVHCLSTHLMHFYAHEDTHILVLLTLHAHAHMALHTHAACAHTDAYMH